MAQNTDITCTAGQWTLLTDSDVTALRAQNRSPWTIILQATSGTSEPSSVGGGVALRGGEILLPDVPLSDLFPGVSSAARVWAYLDYYDAAVSVSHG